MWQYFNPNPAGRTIGDCAIRAISAALGVDWETAKTYLYVMSYQMSTVENSDAAIAGVLRKNGFRRDAIPNECPDCYTAESFCRDHAGDGNTYVLFFGGHVATCKDGDDGEKILLDSWDSSGEYPQYYWYRKET